MLKLDLSPRNGIRSIRTRLISGMLVLVPFVVTLWILRLLLETGSGLLRPVVEWLVADWQFVQNDNGHISYIVSGLSLLLLVGVVYVAGTVTRLVAGRKLLGLSEAVLLRIPLARSIYTGAKQVMHAVSLPNQGAFRSVVMVEFPRPGAWALAFLTGIIQDQAGRRYGKIFMPTSPNPTSGFFQLVPVEEIRKAEMTTEEAFKMIISGGIIAPPVLNNHPLEGDSAVSETKQALPAD